MKSVFARFLFVPIRGLANLVPVKGNLILFGSRKGNWYTDCSRRVYEEMVHNRPDLRPVWMTRNKQVHARLKRDGKPVCSMKSPRGIYLLARARMAVISTQLFDVTRFPSLIPDSLRLVFLGHGKSAKASTLAFKSGRSHGFRKMFERTEQLTDAAVSTSPWIARLAAYANGFPVDRFFVTGYPRNDLLVHPDPSMCARWQDFVEDPEPGFTVLYAPTWRQRGGRTRFFPFEDYHEEDLLRFLEINRVLLLLRPHERDLLNHPDLRRYLERLDRKSRWVRLCDPSAFQNVNHVLPFVDTLVTDYSSISNDYLLLDRPMVFIPYDFEEFDRTQGFMYDYFSTLPGPAVYNQGAFLSMLKDMTRGIDPFRGERRALREKIHTYADGEATKRVLLLINRHLGLNGHARPVDPISVPHGVHTRLEGQA